MRRFLYMAALLAFIPAAANADEWQAYCKGETVIFRMTTTDGILSLQASNKSRINVGTYKSVSGVPANNRCGTRQPGSLDSLLCIESRGSVSGVILIRTPQSPFAPLGEVCEATIIKK